MRPDRNRRFTRVSCFRQLCAGRSFLRRPSLFVWWLKEQSGVWVIHVGKLLGQTKVSRPGLKNSTSRLIFFLQISNFFGSLGNRCQIRSPSTWRRLTHKWRYLLSLSQPPTQQRSCLPITEWKNNYKIIQSLDLCLLWGYFKSKLWQDLPVCKFVYI